MKNVIGILFVTLAINSCGRTVVSTGRNGKAPETVAPSAGTPEEKKKPSASGVGQNHSTPTEPNGTPINGEPANSGTTPSESTSTTTSENQPVSPGRITCFGKSADVAPPELADFCKNIPEDLVGFYAKARKILCEEKRLHNLFLPQCGWTGEGDLQTYFRVIESTPLDDKGDDYYYLSASSLTAGPSVHKFPEVALMAYSDPDNFRKKFSLYATAEIIPDGRGIVQSATDRRAQYHFSVAGLTKTSFTGEMRVVSFGKNLRAVFNTALKDYDGLKARQNLTLVLTLPDGREKLVTIEERLVPDGGQHQIALSKMLKLDYGELENRIKNSKVQ